ncbi:MAG TPA: SAM-dependent methyltransferase [Bacillales bacterium]|nr:SAM-dependent methyltransferase [Bacillales bacterium]
MKNILRNLIEKQSDQRIDYEQYMHTVLYHPEEGYYQKPSVKIGKTGDFYTSPSVHPVFGRTLARFFMKLIKAENLPSVICEVGAGDGQLAKAVLEEWKKYAPDSYSDLTYIAVEESAYHRKEQEKHLSSERSFVQYESLDQLQAEMPVFSGILFFNELLDAMPVRVVQEKKDQLCEVKITLDEVGELTEVLEPCQDSRILNWMDTYGFPLQPGQRVEIPLAMTRWLEKTTEWLERGVMITIDYGYTEKEWVHPGRREGSLRGYLRHQLMKNPLDYPGEMDLTSHIHVDAVRKIAEAKGMEPLFIMTQREFLLKTGILDFLRPLSDSSDPFSGDDRQNRAIRSLVADTSLGHAFYVMAQGRGLEGKYIHEWLAHDPIQEAIKKRR